MGKPEIIGYETDHERWWSCPPMPDITYDSTGISVPCIRIGYDGKPYADTRYLDTDEFDGFMRHHGYKRVYKPREFHAEWRFGGYRIHCKTCCTSSLYAGYLSLDAVRDHVESAHHYSASWPRDLVE